MHHDAVFHADGCTIKKSLVFIGLIAGYSSSKANLEAFVLKTKATILKTFSYVDVLLIMFAAVVIIFAISYESQSRQCQAMMYLFILGRLDRHGGVSYLCGAQDWHSTRPWFQPLGQYRRMPWLL